MTSKPEHRILCVDDEPDVLEAMALTLRRAKEFRALVDTAPSPNAALTRIAVTSYDLILADHRMPEMTGVELLTKVAEISPGTVRALITGVSDVNVALEALEKARIHYYLQKPWDNEDLRVTVLDALTGGWKQKV